MRKNFGAKTWLYPLPVLVVGSYDEAGKPNLMTAAWGGIYDTNQVILCLSDEHKTAKNIRAVGAFTLNIADVENLASCDYVGLESGNKVTDKIEKAGFTVTKSAFVNAPIVDQLPMAVECRLMGETAEGILLGEIVNVSADEAVLNDKGMIDADKLRPISYDPVTHDYRVLGEKVGRAFIDGAKLK